MKATVRNIPFWLWLLVLLGIMGSGSAWAQDTTQVWPGDANANGTVSHVDLLYVGLHYGKTGPARDSISINWTAHDVLKWATPTAGRADPAHADCNGDSTVDFVDVFAIETNYGLDNGSNLSDSSSLSNLQTDPPLSISLPAGSLAVGTRDTLDLILGSPSIPVDSMLGFSATLRYDTSLIDTAYAWFGNSWLGTPGVDMLTFDHQGADTLAIAATRTDRTNRLQTGGVIGGIVVVMDDNLKTYATYEALNLEIIQVLCLKSSGKVVPVYTRPDTLPVYTPSGELEALVYPVPTTSELNIALLNPVQEPIEGILRDAMGRTVKTFGFTGREYVLPCSELQAGLYFLELREGPAVLQKRIVILNE